MTTDSLELAQRLRLSADVLRRTVRNARTFGNVPRRHEAALSQLRRKGPASIADLARMEQVRPQSMGLTIAELAESGLVVKEPDPADRRRELVSLTDEGKQMVAAIGEERDQDLARLLDRNLTAAERRTVAEALDLLARVATHA